MTIEFWKTKSGQWFWTCRSENGEVIADSAEEYSSRAKAVQGAIATATEFEQWRVENQSKPLKTATSGRLKPVVKRSTSSSSQIRKTGKPGG